MPFTLHCYSADRVEIAADSGQQFAFNLIPAGKRRQLRLDRQALEQAKQATYSMSLLRDAMRFAQLCAKDCGLA